MKYIEKINGKQVVLADGQQAITTMGICDTTEFIEAQLNNDYELRDIVTGALLNYLLDDGEYRDYFLSLLFNAIEANVVNDIAEGIRKPRKDIKRC